MADSETKKKPNFFKGVRREFKKITWPTKSDAVKQTLVVTVITIALAALIGLIDLGLKFGLDQLLKISF